MNSAHTVPIGSLAFCIAALAVFILGINLLKLYLRDHNPLGDVHATLTLSAACFMLCLGLPFIVTRNQNILLYADFVGVAFLGVVFICLSRIIWFTYLRNHVNFRWVGITTGLWAGLVLATDILYTSVETTNNTLVYNSAHITLMLKGILFLLLPLPVAFIYFRQVFSVHSLRSKLRLLATSIFITAVSLSGALENFHSGGKGDTSSEIFRLGLSILLLIVAIWPRSRQKVTQAQNPNI